MALAAANLQLIYGFDETQIKAVRANDGEAGDDFDLVTYTQETTPGDGLAVFSDDKGGRCVYLGNTATGGGSWDHHTLRSASYTHPHAASPIPPAVAGAGYAVGWRFKWVSPYHDENAADIDAFQVWAYGTSSSVKPQMGLQLNDATTPTAARLNMVLPGFSPITDLSATSTTTGSPASYPIAKDLWYRVVVRHWFNVTGHVWKVWLFEESTGTTYTWTYSGADNTTFTDTFLTPSPLSTHWRMGQVDPTNDPDNVTVYLDNFWYYDTYATDAEIEDVIVNGINIQWAPPTVRRAEHVVYSAVTDQNRSFPKTRALATGTTIGRHPVGVFCQAPRIRVEGWRPGRPWLLRTVDAVFDPAGPYGSQTARKGERMNLTLGVWRTPGIKPPGACEDARDVEFTHEGPRRRKGFRVRRDTGDTNIRGFNQFWTFRDFGDELYRLYKAGSAMYAEDGAQANSISTGWSSNEAVSGFQFDGRLVLLSATKQRTWDGTLTALQTLGGAAPGSISPAASSGGTLNGTYYYAATWYDPTSGDETGGIISASVSPSTQKVRLTLPASTAAPDTRYTQFRIYRTAVGGSAPNLFFTATVTATAGSTVYDDTGDADGTTLIGQVLDSSGTFLGYITGTPPDTFSIGCVHQERVVYARGSTYPERVYIGEPGEIARWYSSQWFAADGPVRAVASWGSRLVVFTDNTVELVESDFIRNADGQLDLNRTVISRSIGCIGANAVISFGGQLYWMDSRGIYRMEGGRAVEVSDRIRDLFPWVNGNVGDRIAGAWNHISNTLVWTVPCAALQEDSNRMQTQFVMDLETPDRWTIFGLDASFVGQFDDDRNGIRFGAIDMVGVFKELETYEGDGAEGNETFTTEDEGTDDYAGSPAGILSVADKVVTVYGSPGWATNELRGMQVVLRDRSTGLLYRYLIAANDGTTFTTERQVSANLGEGDGYYIGGIPAFCQFAAHDFGSANRKTIQQVQYELADLTLTDLYL